MLNILVTCRSALLALLIFQLSASVVNGEPNEILRPAGTVALGRIEGPIGSITADADGGRLFVAEDVYPPVIVAIDVKAGKEAGRATEGVASPAGAAFAPDSDRLLISDKGRISIYESSLALRGVVEDLFKANCVGYDPVSKLAYVGHHDARDWIAVIDPRNAQKVGDIPVDGRPEGFQLETKGDRIFVNIPHMQQIAVIDRQKRAVVGIWPLQDPRWSFPYNYPMALDEEHRRLVVGCRNPAKLVIIDTDNGKIVSTVDCCPGVCNVYYDAKRQRIYASGDEYVSVFKQADPNTYRIVGFVTTNSQANTSLFVPATRKLYVAVEDRKSGLTNLMVFDCGTDAAPATAPAANAGN